MDQTSCCLPICRIKTLQTWVLGTTHRLNVIYIYAKLFQKIYLSVSFALNQAILAHSYTPSNDVAHMCEVMYMYIELLQLMKELWNRQVLLSHFTLKCGLDLRPRLNAHCLMMVNISIKLY